LQSTILSSAPRQGPCGPGNLGGNLRKVMNLTIVRGPLEAWKNEVILHQYNLLTSSRIPMREFLHWVQNGPEGPAWHALLETTDSEIVGHSAVIPLRSYCNGRRVVAGKSEYSFILEEYQTAKIRGFETLGRPRNAIMVQQLFQRCQAEGFGPLLISTSALRQRSLSTMGCSAAKFPVSECLLILRPWDASRRTPNLHRWQRASVWLAGIFQKTAWSLARLFWLESNAIHVVPVDDSLSSGENDGLYLFDDVESVKWRYLEGQYERLGFNADTGAYVIVKKGSPDRYLRVCQWRLGGEEPTFQLITKLVELAESEKALGVRWAFYGGDDMAKDLARRMRRLGFLCAQRARTLLIYSTEREFLSADKWNLTDAMFSFDP